MSQHGGGARYGWGCHMQLRAGRLDIGSAGSSAQEEASAVCLVDTRCYRVRMIFNVVARWRIVSWRVSKSAMTILTSITPAALQFCGIFVFEATGGSTLSQMRSTRLERFCIVVRVIDWRDLQRTSSSRCERIWKWYQ